MSWYIRKAFSIGPLRLNLSKSGLGFSLGIKGARIGTGPRGAYVHMGRKGLYYKQSIPPNSTSQGTIIPELEFPESKNFNEVHLTDSSSEKIVSQINKNLQNVPVAPFLWFLTLTLFLVSFGVSGLLSTILKFLALLIAASAILFRSIDRSHKTTPLFYNIEEKAAENLNHVEAAFEILMKVNRVWQTTMHQGLLVNRKSVKVGWMMPSFIQTNIKVFGISGESLKIFFFPDRLFLFQNKKYQALSYSSFKIEISPISFQETEALPVDCEILNHIWLHSRKDGGPDRRYAYNPQIPVVKYALFRIVTPDNDSISYLGSSFPLMIEFAEKLKEYNNLLDDTIPPAIESQQ